MKHRHIPFFNSVIALLFCVSATPLIANDKDWPTFRGADRIERGSRLGIA